MDDAPILPDSLFQLEDLSIDDYLKIAQDYALVGKHRLELHDGRLFDKGLPSYGFSPLVNSRAAMELAVSIGNVSMDAGIGQPTTARVGFVVGKQRLYMPEVGYIQQERLKLWGEPLFQGAPDIAAEFAIPDAPPPLSYAQKARHYLDAGASLVWIVYVDERVVVEYTRQDKQWLAARTLTDADTLTAPDLLLGFELSLADLFH